MNADLERLAREVRDVEAAAREKRIAYNMAVHADRKRQMVVLQDLYRDGTLTDDFLENDLLLEPSIMNEITGLAKKIAEQSVSVSGDGPSFADRIEAENENAGHDE